VSAGLPAGVAAQRRSDHRFPPGGRSVFRPTASTKNQTALAGWSGRPLRCDGRVAGSGRQVRCVLPMLPCNRRQHDPGRGLPPLGRPWALVPCALAAGGSADQPHFRLLPSCRGGLGRLLCWAALASLPSSLVVEISAPRAAARLGSTILTERRTNRQRHRQVPGLGGVNPRLPFWGRTVSSMVVGFQKTPWQLFCTPEVTGAFLTHSQQSVCLARSGQRTGFVPFALGRLLPGADDPPSAAQQRLTALSLDAARRLVGHGPSGSTALFLYLLGFPTLVRAGMMKGPIPSPPLFGYFWAAI